MIDGPKREGCGCRDEFLLHFEAIDLDLGEVTASVSLPLLLALATLPGKQSAPGTPRAESAARGTPSPPMASSQLLRLLPDQVLSSNDVYHLLRK